MPHGRKGAGVLSSLTGADGLAELPFEASEIAEGDWLSVIPLLSFSDIMGKYKRHYYADTLFCMAKDHTGCSHETIALPQEVSTIAQLIAHLEWGAQVTSVPFKTAKLCVSRLIRSLPRKMIRLQIVMKLASFRR